MLFTNCENAGIESFFVSCGHIIDEIKLVFSGNNNMVIIKANADNIPFSIDYNDKTHTNYIITLKQEDYVF